MEELPAGEIQKMLLQPEAFCVLGKGGDLVLKPHKDKRSGDKQR